MDDYYLIVKENILYIILFVLYYELFYLFYNYLGFLWDKRIIVDKKLKVFIWLRKFVEFDVDIGVSYFYIRRLFFYFLFILFNG